jgi:hypothetical protein
MHNAVRDRPKLTPSIKKQLAAIEPSKDWGVEYFPCDVTLKDGVKIERVYFVAEIPFLKKWGISPDADPGKKALDLEAVLTVVDSRFRLPARFANRLYEHGESGMGYYKFTVVFESGWSQAYLTGDAVDFISYPEGFAKEDVLDVLPNTMPNLACIKGPDYCWCLFSE